MNQPPAPECLFYLFETHRRIRRRIKGNGFAIPPIGWDDFANFQQLTARRLSPWEIQVLEDLDDLFVLAKSNPPE